MGRTNTLRQAPLLARGPRMTFGEKLRGWADGSKILSGVATANC